MEKITTIEQLSSDILVFEVNGQRFEVSDIDPSTTLLEFLRTRTTFKSVKLGCGEGGCGACVVLLSKFDPKLKKVESYTVTSCLTLLCSINGCSITTSEGLGNSKDGFHPIHRRFSGFHASQCGFCTPGMCVSLFSALADAEKNDQSESSPPGFSKVTVSKAEKAISGNLCRCTGYRPIADACKSFASNVDLEDLGINCFWRKSDSKEEKALSLPNYKPEEHTMPYTEVMREEYSVKRILNSGKNSWYSPTTIDELLKLMENSYNDENGKKTKMVVGNTGTGYYKEIEGYDVYVDLRHIDELSCCREDESGVEIGAALSISKVVKYLKEKRGYSVFSKIADHMEKIASPFVRNSASLGGNLVMAQRNNFPSDISTLLLSANASVRILSVQKHEKIITVDDFLGSPPLDPKSVLLSVYIPFPESNSRVYFETYRPSLRPLGNALPYLNAAFFADISTNENGVLVNDVRLAFGALGGKRLTRARKVENHLAGKILSVRLFKEAVKLLKDEIVSEEGEVSQADYRSSLAVAFLFEFFDKFLSRVDPLRSEFPNGSSNHRNNNGEKNEPLLSSAKQVVESSEEHCPVGEPMPKFGSTIQSSGEAVFVDDIPSPPNCLHGALILSAKPLARVKITFPPHLKPTDHTQIITVKDIPKGGENVGCVNMFGAEPLFADEVSRFAGDLIGFVVAESQKKANLAAKMAHVDYDTEGLGPPILTVEEAVERSSFFEVPPFLSPQNVGDYSKGMEEAQHKIFSAEIKLGSQYYFYMETQTALAIPDEDNCIVVYSSSQCPEFAHRAIAKCLGIPDNNVRVLTRRVGGGFGGKAMKSMPIATICALAAHKLRRPVRTYLDRQTDMITAGGRHPMKIKYDVGFKSDGKITALHLDIHINAGITSDISPVMPHNVVCALKKYDWGALSLNIKVCKTNHSSKSAMRGPGEVQGSYIAEAILERVASALSISADDIRRKNLHTYESLALFYGGAAGESLEYTLPSILDKLAISSEFERRITEIERFNQLNVWRKRGISRIPIVHEVFVRPAPGKVSILWDGSIVVEVGGIDLGQGLWTKVRQVTAYALGAIKCEGVEGLVEKIRVVQSDTLSLVRGGFTAGSTTSESSCEAVRLCCDALVERLAPIKEKMGSVTWDLLILQAHYQNVNLAANSLFVPEIDSLKYLNYGAAVSEVEVNVLTGETAILRTDIVYDCGQSMNPAVDLGQIEGAFVQGIGFFMTEEYLTNPEGLVVSTGTWSYKIPTIDTIPRELNVEVVNSGHHKNRVLSSKASGEPPLLLAASVHCATRAAIIEARKQRKSWGATEDVDLTFELDVPAVMPVVKRLCGLDNVEIYLQSVLNSDSSSV